uniref:Olfactory receptor n=1 Tax=Anser brachyrhynchus TaxID=132585 RepID=A0A8B9CBY7_9AVES
IMVEDNSTFAPEFFLLGFTSQEDLQVICFVLFLAIYVVSLVGNLGVITLIRIDSCLHTPMYFFLSHLSLLDACYSSTIIPQALLNFLVKRKAISFMRCAAQLFSFATCATAECYVLAAMAYDRYVAICNPLLYPVVMSRRLCIGMLMTVLVYATGFLTSLVHTVLAGRLAFCQARSINHFFCELPALLHLSCSSTRPNHILQVCSAEFNIVGSILVILTSYACILYTVLRMPSAGRRLKVFSTCTSHLAAVTIFYMPGLVTYMLPSKARLQDEEKLVSIFYTAVTPLLNPLVYSLRNREVKGALRRLWGRSLFPHVP